MISCAWIERVSCSSARDNGVSDEADAAWDALALIMEAAVGVDAAEGLPFFDVGFGFVGPYLVKLSCSPH